MDSKLKQLSNFRGSRILTLFGICFSWQVYAQVGVGTATPNGSAQLDVVSPNKGVLLPRVALSGTMDVSSISNGNVESLLVYNTASVSDVVPGFYFWNGKAWTKLTVASDIQALQTITTLVNNNNGTISYTNEAGVVQTVSIDSSSTNELQTISLSGNSLTLSNGGGTVLLPTTGSGASQVLSLTGNTLTLSNGGGSVVLPGGTAQTLSVTGNTLTLSNGGGTITFPPEVDGDITNELQTISLIGSVLSLSNGGGSIILPPEVDGDITNELQTISLTGSVLSLSNGGGSITLPPEVDGDITNELQSISLTGNTISLSNGGGSIVLPPEIDGSITNELQTISLSGNTLTLSNGGGSVLLPTGGGGSGVAQTLSITGNTISLSDGGGSIILPPEIDGSITNEIQSLSLVGNTISLSNGGGSIVLPSEIDGSVTNEIQVLNLAGNTISLSNGGGSITLPPEVDGSVTNELQTISLSGNTISLSNGGGSFSLPNSADGDAWGVTGEDLTSAITRTGNVGIGVTSPTHTLHVQGDVRLQNLPTGSSSTDNVVLANSATGVLGQASLYNLINQMDLNVSYHTGPYTVTANDDILIYTGSTGGQILTLPATGIPIGKRIYVVNTGNQDWQLNVAPINAGIVTCQAAVGTILMHCGGGQWATLNGY